MSEILAPMSANVWKILVKEGDKVKQGDEIMILEAMKMEIPIEAESNGTIISLKVKEGEAIEADILLAIIE